MSNTQIINSIYGIGTGVSYDRTTNLSVRNLNYFIPDDLGSIDVSMLRLTAPCRPKKHSPFVATPFGPYDETKYSGLFKNVNFPESTFAIEDKYQSRATRKDVNPLFGMTTGEDIFPYTQGPDVEFSKYPAARRRLFDLMAMMPKVAKLSKVSYPYTSSWGRLVDSGPDLKLRDNRAIRAYNFSFDFITHKTKHVSYADLANETKCHEILHDMAELYAEKFHSGDKLAYLLFKGSVPLQRLQNRKPSSEHGTYGLVYSSVDKKLHKLDFGSVARQRFVKPIPAFWNWWFALPRQNFQNFYNMSPGLHIGGPSVTGADILAYQQAHDFKGIDVATDKSNYDSTIPFSFFHLLIGNMLKLEIGRAHV